MADMFGMIHHCMESSGHAQTGGCRQQEEGKDDLIGDRCIGVPCVEVFPEKQFCSEEGCCWDQMGVDIY